LRFITERSTFIFRNIQPCSRTSSPPSHHASIIPVSCAFLKSQIISPLSNHTSLRFNRETLKRSTMLSMNSRSRRKTTNLSKIPRQRTETLIQWPLRRDWRSMIYWNSDGLLLNFIFEYILRKEFADNRINAIINIQLICCFKTNCTRMLLIRPRPQETARLRRTCCGTSLIPATRKHLLLCYSRIAFNL
jgi:hypothetical protein